MKNKKVKATLQGHYSKNICEQSVNFDGWAIVPTKSQYQYAKTRCCLPGVDYLRAYVDGKEVYIDDRFYN